jgi:hypothetical protein
MLNGIWYSRSRMFDSYLRMVFTGKTQPNPNHSDRMRREERCWIRVCMPDPILLSMNIRFHGSNEHIYSKKFLTGKKYVCIPKQHKTFTNSCVMLLYAVAYQLTPYLYKTRLYASRNNFCSDSTFAPTASLDRKCIV